MKASGFKLYGPLKAFSEKEAEKWFPGKTLIIRPGLIVGPRDETDRFTYWPVRIDRGGEVLAPGKPNDPVQFIDGRDLAEWTIRMAENRETGIYNATGPAKPLGDRRDARWNQRGPEFEAQRLPGCRLIFSKKKRSRRGRTCRSGPAKESGMARTNISRALGKGLTFRPLTIPRATRWPGSNHSRGTTSELRAGSYARARSRSARAVAQAARLV